MGWAVKFPHCFIPYSGLYGFVSHFSQTFFGGITLIFYIER